MSRPPENPFYAYRRLRHACRLLDHRLGDHELQSALFGITPKAMRDVLRLRGWHAAVERSVAPMPGRDETWLPKGESLDDRAPVMVFVTTQDDAGHAKNTLRAIETIAAMAKESTAEVFAEVLLLVNEAAPRCGGD